MSARSAAICTAAVTAAACGIAGSCGGRAASRPTAIFWTQSPHGGDEERGDIGRAELTGAVAKEHFIVGGKAPAGIASNGRYIYWANYASGTIARAKLDGSDVNQRLVEVGEYAIVGIAVDGRHVYWTNSGLDPGSGTIGRANLDGTGVDERFIRAGDSPTGLAVDGEHIYWTHRDWREKKLGVVFDYAIGRANLDGSDVNKHFIDVANKLTGVAVNSRYILWSNSAEDTIGRANLDGTAVDQRCLTAMKVPLGNVPEGLAVDSEHVYWTNYPADTIGRANLDGSGVNERFAAVKGVPEGIAVLAGDASVSTVARCGTSKPRVLLGPTDQPAGPYAVGWGEVAPPIVSNGGAAASGTVSQIHWSSWGGKVAVGRGLHPEYTPHGGYYPRPLVMEVRASAIRRCKPGGRLVYTRFTVREQVRPGGHMGKWGAWAANMCVGFR